MNFDPGEPTPDGKVVLTAWYEPTSPTRYMYSLNWKAGNGKRYEVEHANPDMLLWMAWEVEMDAQGFKPHTDWEKLLENIEASQKRRRR